MPLGYLSRGPGDQALAPCDLQRRESADVIESAFDGVGAPEREAAVGRREMSARVNAEAGFRRVDGQQRFRSARVLRKELFPRK